LHVLFFYCFRAVYCCFWQPYPSQRSSVIPIRDTRANVFF
jgi:hypothetical protein